MRRQPVYESSESRPADGASRSLLILTKLNPPRATGRTVARPRLYRWLDEAAELAVVLVSAPAGFGKSTLVASWLEQSGRPFAWLSLDEDARDPRLFLRYLFAALDRVEPGAWKGCGSEVRRHDARSDPG